MVSCTETWRHSIILDYISLVCFNQVLTAVIQRLVANIWKTCVVGFRIYLKGWTPNGDMIGVGVFELIYWKKGIPKILFFFFFTKHQICSLLVLFSPFNWHWEHWIFYPWQAHSWSTKPDYVLRIPQIWLGQNLWSNWFKGWSANTGGCGFKRRPRNS